MVVESAAAAHAASEVSGESVMPAAAESAVPAAMVGARLWMMGGLGFVAGLPLPLSAFTLRQWLSESGISLAAIGLSALISIAYSLKFLWAPLLDQARAPLGLARFGRRRGWLLAIQPALVLATVVLALSNPVAAPAGVVAAAAAIAFCSASQDIVIDAWRIESYPQHRQGAALAAYVWGYRVALLISGSAAIKAVDYVGWHGALLGVALLLAAGPLLSLSVPEPSVVIVRSDAAGLGSRLRRAVWEPLHDFLRRRGALLILAFVALFRLGEAMAGIMLAPFYRWLGFDRAAVAVATGVPSLLAVMAGVALGGWLVARLGVGRALLLTGCVQTAAMLMYVVMAYSHGDRGILITTVMTESFAIGTADAAFITFLSGLCSPAFTATQYALLSALAAIAVHTVGSLSGFLADAVGWQAFYALTVLAAFPAMGLMLIILRRYPAGSVSPAAAPTARIAPSQA